MLSIFDFQDLLSTSFFDGNMSIAGMVMYAVVLIIAFAVTRRTTQTLIISIPATLIFGAIGVLSVDLMVVMILITVLALAFNSAKVWRA